MQTCKTIIFIIQHIIYIIQHLQDDEEGDEEDEGSDRIEDGRGEQQILVVVCHSRTNSNAGDSQ